MLYRLITSRYTDLLSYITALLATLWMFVVFQHTSSLPGFLKAVPPEYGVAVAAFTGALLICKYICLEGNAHTITLLNAEKVQLEGIVKNRDLIVAELNMKIAASEAEVLVLHNRIAVMQENSPTKQMSELRKKLRASEEDTKAALSVLVKNMQTRLAVIRNVSDQQLLFAADVLRKEVDLVENAIKREGLSYFELCLKIVDINEHISELKEIELASVNVQPVKDSSVADVWLKFIQANDNADPSAVERAFKFFKVAFHPDRFASESQKVEATKYFQHSVNAHNSVKRMDKDKP